MRIRVAVVLAMTLGLSLLNLRPQQDWESCGFDLQSLAETASNASFVASEVQFVWDRYERCTRFPDTFDLFEDGCASYRRQFEGEEQSLDSELFALNLQTRSVQASCGFELAAASVPGPASPGDYDTYCPLLRSYRGTLGPEDLMAVCNALLSQQQCGRCLRR